MFDKSILTRILVLASILPLSACSTMGYIAHTSSGHLKLMSDRQSISSLIRDENLEPSQINKFENILRMREFASSQLHLPNNKSYTTYVDLDRDYVTWVVFATPTLSLQSKSWCFWVVGCVPYRGYFSEIKAEKFASQLRQQQLDVYVAPVPAYSTLGWFSDPLLSSMLDRGALATAEYIFHELAHQQLYIKNDASFNEAFASAVGQLGVVAWLEAENNKTELQRYNNSQRQKQQIYKVVGSLRQQLIAIYDSAYSESEKMQRKQQAFSSYEQQVVSQLEQWGKFQHYRQWLLADMNNAKLNAFSTYQALVPKFIVLFESCNKDFRQFYQIVESTQRLTNQQRVEFLGRAECGAVTNK